MAHFGVAGHPPAFEASGFARNRVDVVRWLAELGLNALELQMTYGPRMRPDNVIAYGSLASELGITLSVHAAYYIVLTSSDDNKVRRSIDTLKRTFELASQLGAKTIVLHPGSLYNQLPQVALDRFVENAGRFFAEIGKTDIGLFVETAGKLAQLGSVDEIFTISSALTNVHPCIDFGHVHARTLGSLEQQSEIDSLFDRIRSYLDENKEKKIHFHYTPIHFGRRGEIQHRAISDRYPTRSDMTDETRYSSSDGFFHPRAQPIARGLRKIKTNYTVISETFNSQEEGAIALKQIYSL